MLKKRNDEDMSKKDQNNQPKRTPMAKDKIICAID